MEDPTCTVSVGETITSTSDQYGVLDILGSGTFGVVTLCHKVSTNQTVAVKIMKKRFDLSVGKKEEAILQQIKENGSADFNIVQWFGSFNFMDNYCHEFEHLDISLWDYLHEHNALMLKEIRPIVHQLATALTFLKNLGIIHADLKTDNIMMVDRLSQPLKIKVIDFGLARSVSNVTQGSVVQTQVYRAPEVFLGAMFNEAIDVWSMGCIIAELFTGWMLFPGRDEYDMMRRIIHLAGMPPVYLLESGHLTHSFFYTAVGSTKWKFMEYTSLFYGPLQTLEDICKFDPVSSNGQVDPAEESDRAIFLDLLKMMLRVDPNNRLSPEEILRHPFVSLSHQTGLLETDYVIECQSTMRSVLAPPSFEEQRDILLPNTIREEEAPVNSTEPSTSKKHVRDCFDGEDEAWRPLRFFNQVRLGEDSPEESGHTSVDSDDSDDSDGTPTVDEPPVTKRRRVSTENSEEGSSDSEGSSLQLKNETPVSPKRPRLEDADPGFVSDGTPTVDELPVRKCQRKRRRVMEEKSNDSDYDSDGTPRLVIVESPVSLKRQHSETPEEDEDWSGKRRRLGPKAF